MSTAQASSAAPTSPGFDVRLLSADVGDPVPGSPAWRAADATNRWLATAGTRISDASPAVAAARAKATEANPQYVGDPFREPTIRWDGTRRQHLAATFTDREQRVRDVELLSPLDVTSGPHPPLPMPCYHTYGVVQEHVWDWDTW
jgi:hypothetical protein